METGFIGAKPHTLGHRFSKCEQLEISVPQNQGLQASLATKTFGVGMMANILLPCCLCLYCLTCLWQVTNSVVDKYCYTVNTAQTSLWHVLPLLQLLSLTIKSLLICLQTLDSNWSTCCFMTTLCKQVPVQLHIYSKWEPIGKVFQIVHLLVTISLYDNITSVLQCYPYWRLKVLYISHYMALLYWPCILNV